MKKETKDQTSFFSKNPKRKLFGLYYVVDDYESAKEAANIAKFLCGGLLCFSIYLLFPLSEAFYKPDSIESFMSQLGKLVQILLPIWFILKLNKQRYGVVPWVALISVIEGARWAYYIQPGVGGKIIFMLVVLAMSLNAVRGWRGLRQIDKQLSGLQSVPNDEEIDFLERSRKADWLVIKWFVCLFAVILAIYVALT